MRAAPLRGRNAAVTRASDALAMHDGPAV